MIAPRWRHEGPGGSHRPSGARRLRAHGPVIVLVGVLALGTAALAAEPTTDDSLVGTRTEAATPAAEPTSPAPAPGAGGADATPPAPPGPTPPGATTTPSARPTPNPATPPPPPATATPPPASAPAPGPTTSTSSVGGASPTPSELLAQAVTHAEQVAATFPSMELGIAIVDLSTSQRVEGTLGARPFYAASVTKLILAIDMLTRRDSLGLPIAAADLALLTRALGPSDDGAMNALWVAFDGPGAVQRVTARLDLTETALPSDSSQWGEVTVSARDMATLFAFMMSELSPSDRAFLVAAMRGAPVAAADGFDQSFGLLSPGVRADSATDVNGPFAKQGWMALMGGILSLNSVGVVGGNSGYAIALLSTQAVGSDWDRARQQLTAVSDSLAAALS